MHTRLTLRPGQNGTRKLVEKYGEKLVAVRYRYDGESKRRLKTVELIEEALPWAKEEGEVFSNPVSDVLLRIGHHEVDLRNSVKNAGGTWEKDSRHWRISAATAYLMGLESRIVRRP